MTSPKVAQRKLKDLVPDARNANAGTVRGLAMLEDSIRKHGLGRGILLDRNNQIVAGNKTVERAVDLGFENVVIVPTDGKTLVATQRVDLDLDSPEGRELALLDNRVSEIDLSWNPDELAALADEGVDLSALFDPDELAALLADDGSAWGAALGNLPTGDKSPFQQMTFTVSDIQADVVTQALAKAKHAGDFVDTGNENSNGNALWRICDAYLHS